MRRKSVCRAAGSAGRDEIGIGLQNIVRRMLEGREIVAQSARNRFFKRLFERFCAV